MQEDSGRLEYGKVLIGGIAYQVGEDGASPPLPSFVAVVVVLGVAVGAGVGAALRRSAFRPTLHSCVLLLTTRFRAFALPAARRLRVDASCERNAVCAQSCLRRRRTKPAIRFLTLQGS